MYNSFHFDLLTHRDWLTLRYEFVSIRVLSRRRRRFNVVRVFCFVYGDFVRGQEVKLSFRVESSRVETSHESN